MSDCFGDYLRSIDKLLGKPVPVVTDHPYHSDTARNAVGAEAKPEPKAQRGGRGGGGGGGRGRQGGGASSGRGGGGHKPQNRRRSQGRRSSSGR